MNAHLRVETLDQVLTLTLDRPERRNALTLATYRALTEALTEAEAAPTVRAVLVRGAGPSFCSGNDLNDFQRPEFLGADSPVLQFLRAVSTFSKPLIVAAHGDAVGIGTTLLLHADHAVASDDTRFKLPFVQLGLVPEAGSSLFVPALLGHARAMELLVLGEPFTAERALDLGFINEVTAPSQVHERALAVARRYAALPPGAVRATKALLRAPGRELVPRALHEDAQVFAQRLRSPETLEAITAFLEKRAPDFSRFG